MEIRIIKDSENKLASRREIEFYILQDAGTSKKTEVKTELCKKLSLNPDWTLIVRIDQSFGARQARAIAHSYQSQDMMLKFEQKFLLERKGKKKKGEPAAPKAEGDATAK